MGASFVIVGVMVAAIVLLSIDSGSDYEAEPSDQRPAEIAGWGSVPGTSISFWEWCGKSRTDDPGVSGRRIGQRAFRSEAGPEFSATKACASAIGIDASRYRKATFMTRRTWPGMLAPL